MINATFSPQRTPSQRHGRSRDLGLPHPSCRREGTSLPPHQNQALSALLFLYRHVLHRDIELPTDLIRAERSKTLPTLLTHAKAFAVINQMSGVTKLMAQLLYGSGLRLMECLRLRVKDTDFGNHQIVVRDGKTLECTRWIFLAQMRIWDNPIRIVPHS